MVDGCSDQIAFDGGIGWGAGQLASVLDALSGRGLHGLIVYPGRRLDFAGNAYPALTRTPFGKEIAP
jgi:hypothetical protein